SSLSPPQPAAPSDPLDLGGCLWGPSTAPGQDMDALEQTSLSLEKRGFGGGAGRRVTCALVAQPGGRLWRVGLIDGEVESTHRP
ncbi:unnamed protein product, partial [Discosporangium mesarthrocarpum]